VKLEDTAGEGWQKGSHRHDTPKTDTKTRVRIDPKACKMRRRVLGICAMDQQSAMELAETQTHAAALCPIFSMDAFLSCTAAWYRASLPFRVRFKRLACGETVFELGLKPRAASCPARRYSATKNMNTAGKGQTASRDIRGGGQVKGIRLLLFNINYHMRTLIILGNETAHSLIARQSCIKVN
jgi:hypothetical protein